MTGYISGGSATAGVVLKTIDGGSNWIQLPETGSNWLFGIYFSDPVTGWTGGINGTMLYTSNGGSNWISQTSGTSNRIVSLSFKDNNTGWAAGYAGTILHTTNGGNLWTPQISTTTENLWFVDFIDSNLGWAAGWNGTILHTTNGGITSASQMYQEIQDKFILHQNYPNPFNPETKIKFHIPEEMPVNITVYNLLGEEIITLLNRELTPGVHEVEFNSGNLNLPGGLYFYRLTAGDISETKKMILIK